ncbi:MAG: DUF1361 domain-containing protein [Chroococcidiopsidaceae cyanobacterium CP_BM_ER_R8_30]|nr:DUF1361 domain-containing protein [Chroococcidiopsidaceae cyanobacterium CP_BM_ER_R8_30]
MKAELITFLTHIWQGVLSNIRWMSWNLFLAFVPLALSFWLFRKRRSRSWFWWLGGLVFLAFLPNAPYVLTDVIHLIQEIRKVNSVWLITLVVIPGYILYILCGFEAYVLSLINLDHYLNRLRLGRWMLIAEVICHLLSAIGIYLGRFLRFNSWDLVTAPDAIATEVVNNVVGKRPLVIIAITFIIVAGLYWVMKRVSLATVLRKSQRCS